ncbi:hypothetical protein L596_025619 [Steinernema carpocapsae]|uniref:Ribosomal protein L7Ae/L30e/S12e/Gadd45 domain-containing protein n=1 Tax=Steinernema carpocapsae TaxID=34508 RepID=A0A4U5M8B2_STECR|nr:hypothetical protein L596_025619 [Steinernema carpocapsae]
MLKQKPAKPYLKSSLKFDWHAEQNTTNAEEVFEKLSSFLESKGFKRTRLPRKRKLPEAEELPSTSSQEALKPQKLPQHEAACVGLRSVLRGLETQELKAAILDASLLKPTAVCSALSFFAHGCKKNCAIYAVDGLDSSLAKRLSMKTISAVGFKANSEDIIGFLKEKWTPVSLQEAVDPRRTAAPLELSTPIGKIGKKKRKRSGK